MKTIIYGTHTATGDALNVNSYIGETLDYEKVQWWNFNNNANNSPKYGGVSLSTPDKLIWGFGFNGSIDTNGTMKVSVRNYGTILINKKFNAPYNANAIITGFVPTIFTATISGNTMTVTGITSGSIISGMLISGTTIVLGTTITGFVSGTNGGVGIYTVSNVHNIDTDITISSNISGRIGVYTVSPAPTTAVADTFMYLNIDVTGSVTGNSLTSNRTTTLTLSDTPYAGWGKWITPYSKDLVIFDAPITFNAAIDTAGYMTATAPTGGTIKLGQMVFGNNIDDRTVVTSFLYATFIAGIDTSGRMTVTSVSYGTIQSWKPIDGVGVPSGISSDDTKFISGTYGGIGVYTVSPAPTTAVPAGTVMHVTGTEVINATNGGAGIYIVSPKPSVAIPTGTAITARALLGSIISSTSTTSHTLMVAPNLNAYPVPANSILYAYSLGPSKINGSPVFTVVDNHPVLLCMIENTTAKSGYSAKTLSTYVPQINTIMETQHGRNGIGEAGY